MFTRYLFTFLLLIAGLCASAQQQFKVTQFMYNQLLYNPAAAGMGEHEFNANAATRFQWSSIEGAPTTQFFWTDYRFTAKRMALGLNLNRDKIGVNKTTDFFLNYAYHIQVNRNVKFSMGLKGGFTYANFDAAELQRIWDANDPVVSGASGFLPKFGLGFYLKGRKMYAGLSVPDLYTVDKQNILGEQNQTFFDKKKNMNLSLGGSFDLSDKYRLQPNVIVYYYKGTDVNADLNLTFYVTNYFWAGASYSLNNSYAVLLGAHISSRFRFGYSYDIGVTGTKTPLNTHEVALMMNLDDLFR